MLILVLAKQQFYSRDSFNGRFGVDRLVISCLGSKICTESGIPFQGSAPFHMQTVSSGRGEIYANLV